MNNKTAIENTNNNMEISNIFYDNYFYYVIIQL